MVFQNVSEFAVVSETSSIWEHDRHADLGSSQELVNQELHLSDPPNPSR